MPYVLIRESLCRIRKTRKLDQRAAAKLLGLSEKTIKRHERVSRDPLALQPESIKRYCRGYECQSKDFCYWVDPAELALLRKRKQSGVLGSLSDRARQEISLGIRDTIEVASESLELVSNVIVQDCMTACAIREGERYAVQGLVTAAEHLGATSAAALGAKVGAGASFRIDRDGTQGVAVDVTVATSDPQHTRRLLDSHRRGEAVTVVVQVVVKSPTAEWRGFPVFEKSAPARPWAFLVEQVVSTGATRASPAASNAG